MIAFFVGLPLFLLKPSKFATSFTLGSILLMTRYFYTHTQDSKTGHYVLAGRRPTKTKAEGTDSRRRYTQQDRNPEELIT